MATETASENKTKTRLKSVKYLSVKFILQTLLLIPKGILPTYF